MKKIISILLIVLISVVGCSNGLVEQESKEEVGKDIGTEIEKDELEEIEETDESKEKEGGEASKDPEEIITFSGNLILAGTELGHRIELSEKVNINGNEVEQIFFNKKESILTYIPREYLTYYLEGETSLDEIYSGKIPLTITANKDSFIYDSDRYLGWIDIEDVLSIDGVSNPKKQSDKEHTTKYYKDIFEVKIGYMYGIDKTEDIKQIKLYKEDDLFKEAVDNLLARGFYIVLDGDSYKITDTKPTGKKEY